MVAKNKEPKYWVDQEKRKRFPKKLFKKVYVPVEAEMEAFIKRNKRLPEHVYEVKK